MYTGQVKISESGGESRAESLLELFRLGCFFTDEMFQEVLIAQEIIPHMNSSTAVIFMQELSNPRSFGDALHRPPGARPKAFLGDFCMLYLYKNLPVILRQDERRIMTLSEN